MRDDNQAFAFRDAGRERAYISDALVQGKTIFGVLLLTSKYKCSTY